MDKLTLNKKFYNRSQYENVIDTNFSELISTSPITPPSPEESLLVDESVIEEFFQTYEQIFLQIPKSGATNSHEYLIKKSSEYVDSNMISSEIQALIDEINLLQQQNLDLNQQLVNTQISSSQQI